MTNFTQKNGLVCHDKVIEFKDDNGCILEVYHSRMAEPMLPRSGSRRLRSNVLWGVSERGVRECIVYDCKI